MEITDQHPMAETLAVVERFSCRLGKPVKQCVRAVYPWEMRQEITDKLAYMRPHFEDWKKKGLPELAAIYHRAQEKPSAKLVSSKTLAKRFVEHNGFVRHDLCRWDDYGWCKRVPHGYWLHLNLSINPTARYALPVNIKLICYGVNFRAIYGCSLCEDFHAANDAHADEAAFQVFQAVLDRFHQEMLPQLFEVFGETPEAFYQHSHAFDYSGEFDL